MRSLSVNSQFVTILLAVAAGYLLIRMFLKSRPAISPAEADAAIKAGTAVLVDVREPSEWPDGVATPATLLPLSDLRGKRVGWKPFLQENKNKRIIVYCLSGARSGMAAATLKSEGFDAANLGGLSQWVTSGLAVRRP
jgi:rhodanese-related sulfurtransferase